MLAAELRQRNTKAVQAMRVLNNDGLNRWLSIYAKNLADQIMDSGVEVL